MSHGDKYSKVSKIDCLLFMQLAKAKYVDAMKFDIILLFYYVQCTKIHKIRSKVQGTNSHTKLIIFPFINHNI